MKLSVNNFQCWEHMDITLEGLTVLVGPSNKGKSSASRALKAVLRNDIPEEFIRNSQSDPLSITFEHDGVVVTATRKRKGSTHYAVTKDGSTDKFSSLGRKLPEAVAALKFSEIKIGDFLLDPIFSSQNKSQFLIDNDRWKPNELNAILGAFSSTEKLDIGKKQANLRLSKGKSEAGTLAEEVRKGEGRIQKISSLSSAMKEVNQCIETASVDILSLEEKELSFIACVKASNEYRLINKVLASLEVPSLDDVQKYQLKDKLVGSLTASKLLKVNIDESLNSLAKTSSLWSEVNSTQLQQTYFSNLVNSLSFIEGSSRIVELLVSQLSKIDSLLEKIQVLSKIRDVVDSLCESKESRVLLQNKLTKADSEVTLVQGELSSLQEERVKEEMAAQQQSGVCPMCGSRINKGEYGNSSGKNKTSPNTNKVTKQ